MSKTCGRYGINQRVTMQPALRGFPTAERWVRLDGEFVGYAFLDQGPGVWHFRSDRYPSIRGVTGITLNYLADKIEQRMSKTCEITLATPRGTFKIHTIFDSEEEARVEGWGFWFQHEKYLILGRDNRTGAVVRVKGDQP